LTKSINDVNIITMEKEMTQQELDDWIKGQLGFGS
tara:strand:+ start:12784 stop:12888 length:105 start_codon:yes stop_codon:yes gene_type:complete